MDDGIVISRISLDSEGRLRLFPLVKRDVWDGYEFIYRAALSVAWDEKERCLFMQPFDGFSTVDQMKQILLAVKQEYGERLGVNETTEFVGIADDVGRELCALGGWWLRPGESIGPAAQRNEDCEGQGRLFEE